MKGCLVLVAAVAACSFRAPGGTPGDGAMSDGEGRDAEGPDSHPSDGAAGDASTVLDAELGQELPVPMMLDVVSTADVYLRTTVAPDENTNNLDYVIVDGDNIASALLRFDLSGIPPNAVVTAAELRLFVDDDPGAPVTVYELLQSWDEATATSNQRATGMAWLGPGATPPSRGTTAIGSLSPMPANITATGPLTLIVVQGWVTTPALNYGLVISTTNADGPRFASRERANQGQRPILHLEYSL